jgi:hypothetical protein
LHNIIHHGRNVEHVIGDEEDEDNYNDEDDEEQEAKLVDVDTGVTSKKKKKKKVGDTRGPKWKTLEDKCPIDSLNALSFYPITSAKQKLGKYYKGFYDKLTERKNFVDHATIHMIHNESAMSRWWNIIKMACNKFHRCKTKAEKGKASGQPMLDVISHFLSMPMFLCSPLCSSYDIANW